MIFPKRFSYLIILFSIVLTTHFAHCDDVLVIKGYRDLPSDIRSQVQKEYDTFKNRWKKEASQIQLGHLFYCYPFCEKAGVFFMARDQKGEEGIQLKLIQEINLKKRHTLRFVPRSSNLYLVFKSDQSHNETQPTSEAAKKYEPVLLSKGDDSEVFRLADNEYLLPFQNKRWGIITSLQTSFMSRSVSSQNQVAEDWNMPWTLFFAPSIDLILPGSIFGMRALVGADYKFSLFNESDSSTSGNVNSSLFGYYLSFLYPVTPKFLLGLSLRFEDSTISTELNSPVGFTSKSDITWFGLRGYYRWLFAEVLYGLSSSISDEIDYRGQAKIDSAVSTTIKFCPYSKRLWIFETFPCGYINYRLEKQTAPGNSVTPSLDVESQTSISNISAGINIELGQYF